MKINRNEYFLLNVMKLMMSVDEISVVFNISSLYANTNLLKRRFS